MSHLSSTLRTCRRRSSVGSACPVHGKMPTTDEWLEYIALVVAAGMLLIVLWRGRMLLSLHRRAMARNGVRIAFALCTIGLLVSARFAIDADEVRRRRLPYVGGGMAFLWCCCPCFSLELPVGTHAEFRRLYDMGAPEPASALDESTHSVRAGARSSEIMPSVEAV